MGKVEAMNTIGKLAASMMCMLVSSLVFAVDTIYCPQKHGYISIGMTQDQVKAACGEPVSIQESKHGFTEKVPVQQLIYNNMGAPQVIHSPYTVNIRTAGGAQLQIDIVNNKVKSISVNGGGSNAASYCPNGNVQIGDEAAKVYGACGSPTIVNNTWIEVAVPGVTKPIIWIYQPGPNQASVSLTFVDGKLQSID